MNYITFKKILKKINIKNDDIVMLHSNLTNFMPKASWYKKCDTFSKYLNKFFGTKGTVLVPTFTYSFCKTGIYNKKKTKSELGIFPEFYRNKKIDFRSNHPIFSFVSTGKLKNFFIKKNSNSSTGKGSLFEKFHKKNGKILLFGVGIHTCTFLHYIEQTNKVPYRYSKYFFSKKNKKSFEFYVRRIDTHFYYDPNKYSKLETALKKSVILKKLKRNKIVIKSVSSQSLFNFVKEKLEKNIFFIIGKKPKKII